MAAMLPLTGVTVVSLEQAVAAPFATRQLADLGARVIKVERAGAGDFARDYDRAVHGQASYFVWLNRGKESHRAGRQEHARTAGARRLSWPAPTCSCRTSRPAPLTGLACPPGRCVRCTRG